MVSQHQQERLVADGLPRAVNGVPKAFLRCLGHKRDTSADFQDAVVEFVQRFLVGLLLLGRGVFHRYVQFRQAIDDWYCSIFG